MGLVLPHLCMLLWASLSLCLLELHTVSPSVYLIICLKVMPLAGVVHGKIPDSFSIPFSVWPASLLWSKGQTSQCSKHVTPTLAWPVPSLVCFRKCLCLVCNERHVTLTFVLKRGQGLRSCLPPKEDLSKKLLGSGRVVTCNPSPVDGRA